MGPEVLGLVLGPHFEPLASSLQREIHGAAVEAHLRFF